MEQSVAQALWRMVGVCFDLEKSLGENHSGMSIFFKKDSNNPFLPIRNEY